MQDYVYLSKEGPVLGHKNGAQENGGWHVRATNAAELSDLAKAGTPVPICNQLCDGIKTKRYAPIQLPKHDGGKVRIQVWIEYLEPLPLPPGCRPFLIKEIAIADPAYSKILEQGGLLAAEQQPVIYTASGSTPNQIVLSRDRFVQP